MTIHRGRRKAIAQLLSVSSGVALGLPRVAFAQPAKPPALSLTRRVARSTRACAKLFSTSSKSVTASRSSTRVRRTSASCAQWFNRATSNGR